MSLSRSAMTTLAHLDAIYLNNPMCTHPGPLLRYPHLPS